jgi:hypothetical protein
MRSHDPGRRNGTDFRQGVGDSLRNGGIRLGAPGAGSAPAGLGEFASIQLGSNYSSSEFFSRSLGPVHQQFEVFFAPDN